MNNMRQQLQEYLDKTSPEELRRELDKRAHLQMVDVGGKLIPITELPWWRIDMNGWPIETVKGHPFRNFVRLLIQNFRKLIGT